MIPVIQANRFITALNRICEGATMLAAAIEESAWEGFEDHAGMPGKRPHAAAQLAQPCFEDAEELEVSLVEPEPHEPEPVTLEQVRSVLARLSQAGHTDQVRDLITQAGADKLSTVDPSKYGWLLMRAEAIRDA